LDPTNKLLKDFITKCEIEKKRVGIEHEKSKAR
jgi:hypothetical protein